MHQRAIKLLIDTTGEDFRVAEFHDQIGDTQRCLGQFEESKHSYLRAVTLWNESSSSLLEISRTYFKLSHICEELGNATEAADAKQNGNRILGRAGDHLTEEDIDRLLLGWSRI
ncbi:hypothetical protein P175DRAFT_0497473 [Aspergillus ochraceoroseus IBT 24754]|uniref:MalT-like TPR region domain-containing protein n=1 Tax=Aspergillus ochraceoroseus IBT 24754 TaxID=1392256 RepID=A0A2T5M774_9EURO|nr:uncharacterized protein P175DRAFT_0497473 [Aspergillus ochraceoroseus IBT 24754]PTU24356.1 hypothetical protein P175DRAFT_0497473 [Aspergillus ochraceoroseus IBT 24754]